VTTFLRVLRAVACALVGVAIAAVGTGIHRLRPAWGLVFALVIVVSAAVTVRAWARVWGVLAFGVAFVATVVMFGRPGPGGDVLIIAEPVGHVWFFSGAAVAMAYLLPRRWFSDEPIANRSKESASSP
jgi:energy-coupling factor transporter transmembrane protein EcfT